MEKKRFFMKKQPMIQKTVNIGNAPVSEENRSISFIQNELEAKGHNVQVSPKSSQQRDNAISVIEEGKGPGPNGRMLMPRKKKEKKETPFVDGLKAKEVQDIPLDEIKEDTTFQYRFSANVGDLKHSLSLEGQKEPIDLTGSKPYRIIDGFRRFEAIKALGWPAVKAFVHKGISDLEAYKLAFIKNVVRKNLSPMDKANAIFQAKQRGMKTSELAVFFGLSEKQIYRYEELLSFSPELQKLLDKETIKMGHAKVLSDFKIKGKELAEWVKKISEESLSEKKLKKELKKTIGSRPSGKAKLYMKKEKNGFRMYPFTITRDATQAEREKVVKLLLDAIEAIKP